MSNGSGVSRGDRDRNARLGRLRGAVPVVNAVVGIDLADLKQMVVVTDHDSKVLARRTFRCKAWDLGAALDWAADRAGRAGFAGVTVACEPTGHRWRGLGQLAVERGMSFVCVQPLLSSLARKGEDLTSDKTDDKDAVLIARLTAQLRCYLPEPVDPVWGRLRHLGARREQLLETHIRCVQQIRDLLECVWPAVLDAAAQPFKSMTWVAAVSVVVARDDGNLARTRRLGLERFTRLVRAEVTRRGKTKPCLRIVRKVFAALTETAGVVEHRQAALARIGWTLPDWDRACADQDLVEGRMVAVLGQLGLTDLVCSIDGLSPVGAAAILAETGDLSRFTSARALRTTGQAGRPGSAGAEVRHVRRQVAPVRRGTPAAAGRGVAGSMGMPPEQPGVRRPLPTPDQPRDQPAQAHPGPHHRRRRDPAAAVRRHHHRAAL